MPAIRLSRLQTFTPTSGIEDATNIITVGTGYTDAALNTGVGDDSPNYTINTVAPTLIVNKIVINDSGRSKVIADFSFFLDGVSVTSGVVNTTTAGIHTISETADFGYTSTIGGHCATNGTITLALGDVKTCTITNDDIAPRSGGGVGGSYVPPPVPPLIDLVKLPNPLALPNGPGPVTYTYTLRNIGTVAVTNITMVGDTCIPINLISGDTNNDAKLDLEEVWIYNCFTTLLQTHTNTITATGRANGISAIDIASATVVVGAPIVPPLIHITKVPSPLALTSGAGLVTYTYTVTNPGVAPLSNVSIVDDKCTGLPSLVAGHPGDLNKNNLLENNESWSFTCQTNLTKTTTNTATATGTASGLTATDFALATVVVSESVVPGLPNTGFPPRVNNTLVALASILAISFFFCIAHKKQIV